ncbi:MAG: heavy metal translocating P-type ATPase [Lachnospiraceae bacterium]|nr:heavy metal translocating P-type ATPase [Lachnospiraceae bacterium]
MSSKQKKEMRKIAAALIIFLLILGAEKTRMIPVLADNRWVNLIFYLIPWFICGRDVLRKAVLGIRNRQMFDESFLMTVASAGAFITAEHEEAAAVMIFYQIGEWFQSYAVGRSRQSITELMDIAPEYANRETEDGGIETVDPDDVEPGEILVIRPGEKIPVDSEVVSGESMINTAALTGESVPRSARPGDQVISGCINGEGLLRVRALKGYDDSTVARILEMVETASEKKSRTENFITRFARYYTPAVVFGALALAVIPSLIAGNPLAWIYRACTFLVISCPCALVISVPLAFFGGIGAASRNGILVKGSNYLELLAKPGTVITDKTGTLTKGTFRVSGLYPAQGVTEEELLLSACAAEGGSTHPIAVSLFQARGERFPESEAAHFISSENAAGRGLVTLLADGRRIAAGSAALMEELGIPAEAVDAVTRAAAGRGGADAATVCFAAELAGGGEREEADLKKPAGSAQPYRLLGMIAIRDEVKEEAKTAVEELKAAGASRVVMLTGDRKSVGDAVGAELGLTEVHAGLLPQDKMEKVEEYAGRPGTGTLVYIGDGINDAPVLARADVGIAMGSMGSDAAIEAADVVIMDDNLRRIPAVMRIAGRTVSIAKQNIVFALAVKLLILILGALGFADMWAAVFADVGVAVLCILNSMRLLLIRRSGV